MCHWTARWMSSVPLRKSSFARMCSRCESMVCTLTFSSLAISRVLFPRPTS